VENHAHETFHLLPCNSREEKFHSLCELAALEKRPADHSKERLSTLQYNGKDPRPKKKPRKESAAIFSRSAQQCPATRSRRLNNYDAPIASVSIGVALCHELSIDWDALSQHLESWRWR
jgi:hypothetical protein